MTTTREIIDQGLAAERSRAFWSRRLAELGILTGLALVAAAFLTGCGAAGAGGWGSPDVVDSVGGLGSAMTGAGAMSANPILFGAGTLLTGLAGWLRIRAVPPTPPPT